MEESNISGNSVAGFFIILTIFIFYFFYNKTKFKIYPHNKEIETNGMTQIYLQKKSRYKIFNNYNPTLRKEIINLEKIQSNKVDSSNYPAVSMIYEKIMNDKEKAIELSKLSSSDKHLQLVRELICHLIIINTDPIVLDDYEDYICNVLMKNELEEYLNDKISNSNTIKLLAGKKLMSAFI